MSWRKCKTGLVNSVQSPLSLKQNGSRSTEKPKSLATIAQISGALKAYKKNSSIVDSSGSKISSLKKTREKSSVAGSSEHKLEPDSFRVDIVSEPSRDLTKNQVYLDFVADQGREVFNWANDSDADSDFSRDSDIDAPRPFSGLDTGQRLAKLFHPENKPIPVITRTKKLTKRRDASDSADVRPRPPLQNTPSMAMLSEAVLALRESPSALTKMAAESTGGVYQLRRRQPLDVWETENTSSESSPSSTNSAQTIAALATQRQVSKYTTSSPLKPSGLRCVRNADDLVGQNYNGEGVLPEARKRANTGDKYFLHRNSSRILSSLRREKSEDALCIEKHLLNRKNLRRVERYNKARTGRSYSAPPKNRVKREESKFAVFKPEDEETGARRQLHLGDKNPERAGMVIGGGAKRERAAYVLDKLYFGFSQVPTTVLMKLPESGQLDFKGKRGSLQQYCPNQGSADENPMLVSKCSSDQVHRIGILDLRIFNTDRHGGNILCQLYRSDEQDKIRLIPIDHALSLPDYRFLSEAYFDWVYWKQSEDKFDQRTLEYVANINIGKDAAALRDINIPETCVATNIISTIALKAGVRNGLSLRDLGEVFQRPFMAGHQDHDKYLSPLEYMVSEASNNIGFHYDIGAKLASVEEVRTLQEGFHGEEAAAVDSLSTSKLSDDYPIESSIERVGVDLDSETDEEHTRNESEPVNDESVVFGNNPPPDSLYGELDYVIERHFTEGTWREWLL
mmetsp:Transcript_17295/g.19670  ORF Transcript_17295/g.19670 Transcript_17295/m.19670 type:complete len:738 (-) Transcript_17295:655-2868(-)|eukprot:CAMPEP_0184020802 /NCGR_PEP_ID=MMETSP0954-20121128/9557_1 /TAXON_ID=627963 /ORGANISM="Aplanochytrium sp, Strain PBS07" /LENGTH=737 /DNA_ID=CAMNT_0026302715 /DNA_START=329 /DNA_END=2542 /DNA_ORIENTATION=-